VNNQRAFEHMIENRQAAVEAAKKINEVVLLDDSTVTDQHAAIVTELQRLAVVAEKEEHFTLGSLLDVKGSEIPRNKADMPAFIKRNDQTIAESEPHTNLKVIQGVQP
jgi:hypothetical protein